MRSLEIILALILLVYILAPLIRMSCWIEWISFAALGVMGFHLFWEGYRWQMLPLYGITLGLGLFSIRRKIRQKSGHEALPTGSLTQIAGGIIILGIVTIPPILLPVPQTPKPMGPFQTGTTTLMLVDQSRKELFASKDGESRAIMLQIWYPAEVESGTETAPWLENMDVMGPAISKKLDLPAFFLDHIEYSHSHSVVDAPISSAEKQYPLLLFSHGWDGFRAQNTYQVEELASHGYVVAAPDHTYGAVAAVFPDGRVSLNNPKALPTGMGLSDTEFLVAAQRLGKQWAGDLSFILDTLANLDPGDVAGQLAYRLDFTHVGALGHSTGGGAAIQFCATDPRCKAVLGMDPYMDPVASTVLAEGLSQPNMAIFSDVWAKDRSHNNAIFQSFSDNSMGDNYRYYIEQTDHYDFTDMPAFSPLAPYLGLKGPLNGDRVLEIINTYTTAFFGHYFKNELSPLLSQTSTEFPEIIDLP
jgi:predicted dienelactone hydrolase